MQEVGPGSGKKVQQKPKEIDAFCVSGGYGVCETVLGFRCNQMPALWLERQIVNLAKMSELSHLWFKNGEILQRGVSRRETADEERNKGGIIYGNTCIKVYCAEKKL